MSLQANIWREQAKLDITQKVYKPLPKLAEILSGLYRTFIMLCTFAQKLKCSDISLPIFIAANFCLAYRK